MNYYDLGRQDKLTNTERDVSKLPAHNALEYGRGWIDQAFNSKEYQNESSD